jgi:hypothetical protein
MDQENRSQQAAALLVSNNDQRQLNARCSHGWHDDAASTGSVTTGEYQHESESYTTIVHINHHQLLI